MLRRYSADAALFAHVRDDKVGAGKTGAVQKAYVKGEVSWCGRSEFRERVRRN